MRDNFLPISAQDIKKRGWKELDIILITGDAYVDHPSYGTAVISRVLEREGYKVGIISQPNWRSKDDFARLGRPRLFFGITSGNTDSMVANYTANKKLRHGDDYSPGGRAGLRPDRAILVYANRVREAFGDITIVLGGIEASLRRLAHYDYWDDCIRRSLLVDAKADILAYGMAETQVVEIARYLEGGRDIAMASIRGTVTIGKEVEKLSDCVEIPSFEDIKADKEKFNQAFKMIYREMNPFAAKKVAQRHADRFVIQQPPALPLEAEQLDKIYELPYSRKCHPVYAAAGGLKGFETVKFSIISHRGCCGECSFCSLYFHQGRIVQSRSPASIVKEARILAEQSDFKGTISDIGGPTANLYRASCNVWGKRGFCENKNCLLPTKCKDLNLGYQQTTALYRMIRQIPKVKHLFVGSGFRYDLLADQSAENYLEELCRFHISGQMKVAPEHAVDSVLKVMNKSDSGSYERFAAAFGKMNAKVKKELYLVRYFIVAHPGARLEDALKLGLYLIRRHIYPEQIQDFIPLPMTLAGCMYYTGKDPFTGQLVYTAKTFRERQMQRALIQYKNPSNKKLIRQALRELKAEHLRKLFQV
ncbi:MAG: YgiQ family radical SAM protein [Candidatus Omnitrophota bacterium]